MFEDAEHPQLVVDLTGVDFIDSAGIGLLVEAYKRSQAANGSFALAGTPPPVQRLLGVTGLDAVFPMYDHVEGALAHGRTT